jgi:hypothetical protein
VAIASIGHTFASGTTAQLGQMPVKVPSVVAPDWFVPPLPVSLDGGAPATQTATLLDVNVVAKQQLAANMPGITARALIRRVAKGVAGAAIESQGSNEAKLLGFFVTLFATGTERAETRNWVSLPAQFQVARVPAQEGERRISFGPGMEATVKVARGRDSYVVVLRPNIAAPGVVLVDRDSRVSPKTPSPSPAAAPIPVPAPKN